MDGALAGTFMVVCACVVADDARRNTFKIAKRRHDAKNLFNNNLLQSSHTLPILVSRRTTIPNSQGTYRSESSSTANPFSTLFQKVTGLVTFTQLILLLLGYPNRNRCVL